MENVCVDKCVSVCVCVCEDMNYSSELKQKRENKVTKIV